MDDQSLINRGAPPATDVSGGSAETQPEIPPLSSQEESRSPDVAAGEAAGPPSWPSIPDMPLDDETPTLQRAREDMPILPPLPPQAPPASVNTPGGFYPGAPAMPATQPAPFQPGTIGLPPGLPGGPVTPSAPNAPSVPGASPYGYPGIPSQPAYPSAPTPTQPGWGIPLPSGYPAYPAYPAYPGAASTPFAPPMPLPGAWTPDSRRSWIARPFPFWLSLLLTVGALLLVAAVYVVDEVFVHGDWADGAHAAGVTALVLAGVAVVVLLLRIMLGRRALSAFLVGLLLAVILAGLGTGGVAFSSPLHGLQAQSLEHNGDWSGAIYEYGLTGERGPNAPDIARIYDEWGEQDLQQKSYKSAVERFLIVVTQYGQSGTPVSQAQADLFTAYRAWVQSNNPSVPYNDAISEFVAYRSNPQCDTPCQTSAQAVEAQARFQYGEQLLSQQQYSAAIQQFETVQSQFASSPYAQQSHLDAAKAYLALGQQQLQSSCSDAVPTYQTLAKKYGDTPEGAKAKSALAAPQNVTGNIAKFTDPTRIVYLSRHANPNSFSFSQDYHAGVDGQGNFTFRNVAQGNYNLSAASYVSGNYIIYPYWSEGNNLYSVQVGPLCPTDVGQLSFV